MKQKLSVRGIFVICIAVLIVGISGSLLVNIVHGYTDSLLPTASQISSDISTFDLDDLYDVTDPITRKGYRLSLISLQGVVNKGTPTIYLYNSFGDPALGANDDHWMMDYYKTKNWVTNETSYDDVYSMINAFKNEIQGAVVYDPSKEYTINVATNVAGVENRIMISPDMIADIQALGITDIRDLRDNNFVSSYDAYNWVYTNYWDQQSKDAIACAYYTEGTDYQRDYFIQNKIHTFWLPDKYKHILGDSSHTAYADDEYSVELENKIKEMMYNSPENIPVLGFWYAVTDADASGNRYEVGYKEAKGVGLSSSYGKFTICTDWGGDFSFHSGVPADLTTITQKRQREKPYREYDPTKKYVAFTMIESGDAPSYYQYGFKYMQWDDSYRSEVPVSYGLTPSLYYVMPGILQGIYESATQNSFFFNAITGDGYMYPYPISVDGTTYQYGLYGTSEKNQIEIINDYYKNVSKSMEALDADMLGSYSNIWPGTWNYSYNDLYINSYVTPNVDGLSSIISDMGRLDGMTAGNANRWYNDGVSIHNGITRWSTATGFPPQWDEDSDQLMVDYLVNDIRNYSTNGNFMQCMTLSWQYSGRRLRQVMDVLEPEGYEFVTLDEFEHLWRQSLNCGLTSKDPFNKYSVKHNGATITTSSVLDGNTMGSQVADGNRATYWASTEVDKDNAWIKMEWDTTQVVNKIVLKDIDNPENQIMSGILHFSDGTSIEVGQLSNLGLRVNIEFEPREVTWIQFEVTSVSSTSVSAGLSEFEVYDTRYPAYYVDKARNYGGISSSGEYGAGYEVTKAVDGDTSTRWASQITGPTWIETEMNETGYVNRVKLKWETQNAYTIKTSVDGVNYTQVATGTSTVGKYTDDVFTNQLAKYIRVEIDAYASIWDFEVYNNPELQEDIAINQVTSSSGVWNDDVNFTSDKAVDGNGSSYWAGQTTGESWIEVKLEDKIDINRVSVHWAYSSEYEIQVSTNGLDYVTVKTGNAHLGEVTDDLIPKTQVQYVRVWSPSFSAIYDLNVMKDKYQNSKPEETVQYLPMYEDLFDGANNKTWTSTNSTWTVEAETFKGVADTGSYGYAISGLPSFVNYTLEADMKVNSGTNQCAGLAFRVKDESNHYLLAVYPSQAYIYKVIDGTYSVLGYESMSTVHGVNYTYKIEVIGNEIKVYRNNQLYISTLDADSTFNTGKIGLFVYDQTEATFDNINVQNHIKE